MFNSFVLWVDVSILVDSKNKHVAPTTSCVLRTICEDPTSVSYSVNKKPNYAQIQRIVMTNKGL